MCNFVFSSSHIYKSKMKQMHFNNIFYLIPYIQIIIIQHGISIFKTTNEIFYLLFFVLSFWNLMYIFHILIWTSSIQGLNSRSWLVAME